MKVAIQKCSINEFNSIIDSQGGKQFLLDVSECREQQVCLWQSLTKAYISYYNFNGSKYVKKIYETDLNGMYPDGTLADTVPLSSSIAGIQNALKLPYCHEKGQAPLNGSGILLYNPKYTNKKVYIYEYDMHLAWLQFFGRCKLPDTLVPPRKGFVGPNEIGFNEDRCAFEGEYAEYIFPILHKDFMPFVLKRLKKIDMMPKNSVKRTDAKLAFNAWLGNMQNHNCFIRLAVIWQCNAYVESIWIKYKPICVYGVSDSIASVERIPELEIDPLWSLKKEGYIMLVGQSTNRIWVNSDNIITHASYRGMPQAYLVGKNLSEVDFKIAGNNNVYYLDYERKQITNE